MKIEKFDGGHKPTIHLKIPFLKIKYYYWEGPKITKDSYIDLSGDKALEYAKAIDAQRKRRQNES